jgi:hypothetical protein
MKPINEKLEQLLRAAAKAPPRGAADIPLGLETRVLANWRAGVMEDDSAFLFTLLRRALLGAAAVLALCAAWSFTQPASEAITDGHALATYEQQAGFNP